MGICYIDEDTDVGNFYGKVAFSEFEGTDSFDFYSQVQGDILSLPVAPSLFFLQTRMRFFLKITDYDPAIVGSFGTGLPRAKFGAYTLQNADHNYPVTFINYVNTTSDCFYALISDNFKPESAAYESCASVAEDSILVGIQPSFNTVAPFTYATDLIVQLPPSVVAELLLVYSGFFNFSPGGTSGLDLIYLNF